MSPTKDPETGRFVGRQDNDQPISIILADEADKRTEQEAQAAARKKEEPEKENTDPLEDAKEQVLDEFIGVDRKKEKADRDAEKDKAKADKEKARAAARAKVATKPEPKDEPAQLDAERIAAAVSEGVARVLKPKEEKEAEKKDEPEKATGPEARHIEVLDRMEKLWPDEYKGASRRYKDGQSKLDAYRKTWEKDHPGESFDDESDEHKDYYDKNDLFEFWDSRDYARAAGSIEAERVRGKDDEEKNRDLNAKLTDLERKEKLREDKPKIVRDQIMAAKSFWSNLGDDFSDVMNDDGSVVRERIAELMESDPVAMQDRIDAATTLNTETEAIYGLMNSLVKFDGSNAVHAMIGKLGESMESEILDKPADQQRDDQGRMFMSGAKYYALPKADREKKYWTLSASDLAYHRGRVLAFELQQKLKAEEERLSKRAAALGYSKSNGSIEKDSAESEEHEDLPSQRSAKPRSPTSGSESRLATRQNGARNSFEKSNNAFFDTL